MAISKRQRDALQERLGETVFVGLAMRYGSPSIGAAVAQMIGHGFNRILLAPLYPQYCAATTATALDAAFAELAKMRSQPAVRTLPPYFADPLHIDALKSSMQRQLAALDFTPERLLLSFHGMPERTRTLGDPYYEQCQGTAALLAKQLDLPIDVAFQSRFGRARWLQPATEMVLASYPAEGIKRIARRSRPHANCAALGEGQVGSCRWLFRRDRQLADAEIHPAVGFGPEIVCARG
jgi:ferrochelatase